MTDHPTGPQRPALSLVPPPAPHAGIAAELAATFDEVTLIIDLAAAVEDLALLVERLAHSAQLLPAEKLALDEARAALARADAWYESGPFEDDDDGGR